MGNGMDAVAGKPATRSAWRPMRWWRLLYHDYRRYRAEGHSCLGTIFLTQGFWACCVYRSSRALVEVLPSGPLRAAARALAALLQKAVEIATGICIPRNCEIGGGLYIPRFGAIILSHGDIGRNCTIEQNVTLGQAGKGASRGMPTIGNRVFIGAHSMIVGKITIGDDALVFPGSIVTRSVPPRAVVMGYPAKVTSFDGSFEWIAYDGMESDPERREALEKSRASG